MIVCVCNNISDREIRQAVQMGVTSMTRLRNELGVGTCCGKCHCCAKQVLRDSLDANDFVPRPAVTTIGLQGVHALVRA
jgi:bacterioferritin-associated ferredoxin